jgi:glycosyltransferase involved in cell wall biosynthesis
MDKRTHIAVNTRLLLNNRLEGIGWFIHETFQRITAEHPEIQFHFLFDRAFDPQFIYNSNVTPHVIPPQARHPILFDLWFDYRIPRVLKRTNSKLFISPDGFLSRRTNVPQLPVIHDLNFELHPELLPPHIAKYYRNRFPAFAKKAARIATVSEFSKHDIHSLYGIENEKIDVVYNGVSEVFRPPAEDDAVETKSAFTNGQDYFVFVGSLHPRKNIKRMLEAFDDFAKDNEQIQMLLVGELMWKNNEFMDFYKQLDSKDRIKMCGRLERVQLAKVVAAAKAMVFVPLYEGFGVPVLEAFASETPLIASNVTSLPEVAGKGALYVDPYDVAAITVAMKEILVPEVASRLTSHGTTQLDLFSWEKSSSLLWNSISKAL